MPIKAELDAIDWKILKELQNNGRITNVELASKVGISAPPCLRRVRRLEDESIIKTYQAILDGAQIGQDLVTFCFVGLHRQSEIDLRGFAALVYQWPLVRKAWMISGAFDFLLQCVAPNITTFQNFVLEHLTAAANVASVRTTLTMRLIKDEPPFIL
ncbi:Lrp/AsnC family transcriptional regulator [Bartonella sp. DGB2]|uniref:Lrp/AsnC family transcriptional regulator n=1 Tax=Bartonella sp. DGB2 TaxID=3388426 RepID=UPI0039901535